MYQIAQCIKSKICDAICANPALTPSEVACGKGLGFIPAAVDGASSHTGKVSHEIRKTKQMKGLIDKAWSPMNFEQVADTIVEKTYFDVRVFNPLAPSNKNITLSACYKKHEREKKRAYEQRVREVEHSSFTPLVLAATGGFGYEGTSFYKRLASLLSQKWEAPYSTTLCWLRCRLAFSLLRSSIQAIRGARSSRGHAARLPSAVDLVTSESRISDDP